MESTALRSSNAIRACASRLSASRVIGVSLPLTASKTRADCRNSGKASEGRPVLSKARPNRSRCRAVMPWPGPMVNESIRSALRSTTSAEAKSPVRSRKMANSPDVRATSTLWNALYIVHDEVGKAV